MNDLNRLILTTDWGIDDLDISIHKCGSQSYYEGIPGTSKEKRK